MTPDDPGRRSASRRVSRLRIPARARGRLMATEVKLPRLGQGMESGTIVRWLKAEGEPVKKREPLYELDTDKVTQEVEAETDGVLLKIVVAEGEVQVGTTIAVIGAEGEDIAESPDGDSAKKPPTGIDEADPSRLVATHAITLQEHARTTRPAYRCSRFRDSAVVPSDSESACSTPSAVSGTCSS